MGKVNRRDHLAERCYYRGRRPQVEALEGRHLLATFTVVNSDDSGPGSLRGAIEQANADPAPDTIAFDPAVAGTITLLSGLPVLSTDMVLEGPGASVLTVARSAAPGTPEFPIFAVGTGTLPVVRTDLEVAISGLTLTGGQSTLSGGILNAGTLTLTDFIISNSSGCTFQELTEVRPPV